MGWLALACCTIIAAYGLYRLLTQDRSPEPRKNYPSPKAPLLAPPSLHAPPPVDPHAGPGASPRAHSVPVIDVPSFDIGLPEQQDKENFLPVPEAPRPPVLVMPPTSEGASGAGQMPPPSLPTRSSSPPRLKPPTLSAPPRSTNGLMRPPPSAAASLRVPPQRVLQNTSMQPSKSQTPTSSIMPPGKQVSRKVILEPGHSPLDWAALSSDPNANLRGKDMPDHLVRVTPSQLKTMNGRKGRDAWTVWQGKVYNITPYVPFHPGGKGEILRGAGKDSVKLFMEVHPWVNWDGMLSECLVGILVGEEHEVDSKNELDEMD